MNRFVLASALGALALSSISLAQAADLIVSQPVSNGFVEAPASGNWDGVYLGAFGGWGVGSLVDSDSWFSDNESFDISGWLVGVNVGANFTLADGIVGGVVGDIAWADISGSYDGYDYGIDWQGSARGKLGIDGGVFLPYLTGGIAFAGTHFNDGSDKANATLVGWTAGAGVDVALSENMNLNLEYRYSDYGKAEFDLDKAPEFSFNAHTITAGISFKF